MDRVILYGCAAHQINLVAKDLVPSAIVSKVTDVAKLFRNCHLPHAWPQSEGASKPPMPSAVRWNSVARLLEWYVDEGQKMKKVAEIHPEYFLTGVPKNVLDILKSLSIFKNVEDALKCMKPVSVALDSVQSDKCSNAGAVEERKKLLTCFREMGDAREWLEIVEKRYEKPVPKVWFLANVLHPQYVGASLTKKEWKDAKDCVSYLIS